MTCARVNNSLHGSRVAPSLPAPTALRKLPVKLSKSAIDGIATGAVFGFAAVVGMLVYFCFERKRVERANELKAEADRKEAELEKARNEEEIRKEAIQPMVDSNSKYEIDRKGGRGELDPGVVNELEGGGVPEIEHSRR